MKNYLDSQYIFPFGSPKILFKGPQTQVFAAETPVCPQGFLPTAWWDQEKISSDSPFWKAKFNIRSVNAPPRLGISWDEWIGWMNGHDICGTIHPSEINEGPLKRDYFNRKFHLNQPLIVRHVSFPGGIGS